MDPKCTWNWSLTLALAQLVMPIFLLIYGNFKYWNNSVRLLGANVFVNKNCVSGICDCCFPFGSLSTGFELHIILVQNPDLANLCPPPIIVFYGNSTVGHSPLYIRKYLLTNEAPSWENVAVSCKSVEWFVFVGLYLVIITCL